jgi:hypothetical protein
MMRSRRRTVVAWSHPSGVPALGLPPRLTRARRVGRLLRIGALLTIIRLTPLARAVADRWRILLPGTALTVTGVMLRGSTASCVLLPGLVLLFYAPLVPARSRAEGTPRAKLERELTAFSTPAQRRDLEAILDRYPDDVTLELRDILARQRVAARNGRFPAIGQ